MTDLSASTSVQNPNPLARVLVVDDEKNIRKSVRLVLEGEGYACVEAHDVHSALQISGEQDFDLLILDIRIGERSGAENAGIENSGLELFQTLRGKGIEAPVLFFSGNATLKEAARAIQLGGFDFLEKPVSAEKLVASVKRCLEFDQIRSQLRELRRNTQPAEIIGESHAIREILREIGRVAATETNVLIRGESGSGKELAANAVHAGSARRDGPLVKVNCSAIPDTLIESELFGYEKGAFTGAVTAKKGFFEQAHRGTLFLDEVADLSLAAQAKILRALQSREIQRLGSDRMVKVDVRVIAGTHKDLKQMVAKGLFREDLFYRIHVFPLRMPALRERIEDLPLLFRWFVAKVCQKNSIKEKAVDPEVLEELKRYPWPGNIRELENLVERLMIVSGERILAANLPEEMQRMDDDGEFSDGVPGAFQKDQTLKAFRDGAERSFIVACLRRQKGNISQAALEMGVGRTYLHKRMSQFEIQKKEYL